MKRPTPRVAGPSWLRLGVGLGVLVGLVLVVQVAPDLTGLVVLGAVLAYLLQPFVDRLERRGMSRTMGSALVMSVLVVGFGVAAYLAAPTIVAQGMSLRARWESGELVSLLSRAEVALAQRIGVVRPEQLGLTDATREFLNGDTGPLIGYVPSMLEAISNAIVVPFVLFTLLRDGPLLRKRVLSLLPNRYFEFGMNVLYKADANLGGYLRGQALVAVLVGASTALGLGLLGVDYYLVLGLLTGLANVVPYAGFVVSTGLAVVVSVVTTGDFQQAVGVIILFGFLQTVENVVFQPWITGRTISMDPALVLIAILVGGRLGGVMGMALGVPAAAVLKVVAVETVTSLRRYHL